MRRDVAVAGVVGAAMAAIAFVGVDAAQPDEYVLTAKPFSAQNQIGVTAEGWTYSIPTDVAWRDKLGAFREGGRPDCLPPSDKEEGPVRFTAIPVDVGGVKFRQVVFVECR
jgi:hypothetical protein